MKTSQLVKSYNRREDERISPRDIHEYFNNSETVQNYLMLGIKEIYIYTYVSVENFFLFKIR